MKKIKCEAITQTNFAHMYISEEIFKNIEIKNELRFNFKDQQNDY